MSKTIHIDVSPTPRTLEQESEGCLGFTIGFLIAMVVQAVEINAGCAQYFCGGIYEGYKKEEELLD